MPRAGIRLGIDGEALRLPLSGVGQYAFNICAALERELEDARLFVYGRLAAERLALPSPRWQVRQEALPALRRLPSAVWLKTRAPRLCLEDRLDVFWAARTMHPRLPPPIRTICTVHDLNHLIAPATMQAHSRVMHRLWFAGDVRGAAPLLANSAGTAARVEALLGVRVDEVLRPGLAPRFRPLSEQERPAAARALAARGIRPPYLLWVGTLEPRKNVAALHEAFLALQRRGALAHHQLVLAGAPGWGSRGLLRALRRSQADGVVLAGYLPDALLPDLYALADALVYPSLYEGFGMPVLEARACGTRSVIADLPELIEAGGPTAIVVRPTAEAIAQGVVAAIAAGPVAESGLARRFSWSAAARRMAAIVTR